MSLNVAKKGYSTVEYLSELTFESYVTTKMEPMYEPINQFL